jgi:hypothetical protein
MDFSKTDYKIIKKAISKEMSRFMFNYFILKRQVANTFYNSNYMEFIPTLFLKLYYGG